MNGTKKVTFAEENNQKIVYATTARTMRSTKDLIEKKSDNQQKPPSQNTSNTKKISSFRVITEELPEEKKINTLTSENINQITSWQDFRNKVVWPETNLNKSELDKKARVDELNNYDLIRHLNNLNMVMKQINNKSAKVLTKFGSSCVSNSINKKNDLFNFEILAHLFVNHRNDENDKEDKEIINLIIGILDNTPLSSSELNDNLNIIAGNNGTAACEFLLQAYISKRNKEEEEYLHKNCFTQLFNKFTGDNNKEKKITAAKKLIDFIQNKESKDIDIKELQQLAKDNPELKNSRLGKIFKALETNIKQQQKEIKITRPRP